MAVCNDKICEAIIGCCESLKPSLCGVRGVVMPETSCKQLRLEGVDDVTINQGIGIDLADGVHAYDGDGNEIEVVIDPSEIAKCDVGVHSVKYTAVGKADTMRPTLCGKNAMDTSEDCEGLTSIEAVRTVTIEQIDPPTISGASDTEVASGTNFNPMDGVSAIDGNGNSVDVEFEGEYPATASGRIATFNNESNKPLRSLEVALSPIQDLNGYDHPWVGGAGKNKANLDDIEIGLAWNSTHNSARATVFFPILPNTAYTASIDGGTFDAVYWGELENAGDITNLRLYNPPSFPYTVTTKDTARVGLLQFNKTAISSTDFANVKIQVELGSTATSYEPYSNICPISGRTEVDAVVSPTTDASDGNTYHADLGRILYDGTVDLVTGKVVSEKAMIDLGTLDWTKNDSLSNIFYADISGMKKRTSPHAYPDAICSLYRADNSTASVTVPNGWFMQAVDMERIFVRDDRYIDSTALEFKSGVSGVQFCYELEEPEVYWLTPQQINAFIGTNKAFSENLKAVRVRVEYYKELPQSGSVKYPDGVYYITYTAEDECGNKTEVTRRIVVGDGNKLCKMRLCEGFADCSQNRICEAYTCQAYTACE